MKISTISNPFFDIFIYIALRRQQSNIWTTLILRVATMAPKTQNVTDNLFKKMKRTFTSIIAGLATLAALAQTADIEVSYNMHSFFANGVEKKH